LARVYVDGERYQEALAVCDSLIKEGHPTAAVHYLKGQSQYGLRAFDAAKASLEAALRQQPTPSAEIQSLLAKVIAESPRPAEPIQEAAK
jgi:hypothetical protein